jgi:predicted transposase/invertase (TIGR01784 family)
MAIRHGFLFIYTVQFNLFMLKFKEDYMNNNQNLIPLKDLNLTNRFLFDAVMEDPATQQDMLSIIFGREIPLIQQSASEKELRLSPLSRSIRMDIFSIDDEQTIYNTEMQNRKLNDLAKRSRYYQALMDTSLLPTGIPDYTVLNQTYFIMIMTFDLFGFQKYQYTFRPRCEEVPDCVLDDGATRIFLNTRGKNDSEVSQELIDLLHYIENTYDAVAAASESSRIHHIHERVQKVKANEEIGVKYMQAWEERYYDKLDARLEGKREGRIEERISSILELLEELGPIPEELKAKLERIDDLVLLKQLHRVAAKADSIEQFKTAMDELF